MERVCYEVRRWFHERRNLVQCQMKETGVEDWRKKFSCQLSQVQREQILADAKSEIQKCEAKASFDDFFFRELKSQIDIRDWDFRRTLEGYMEASQAKDRLRQEVVDRVRALQEDRLSGFREIESVKRDH